MILSIIALIVSVLSAGVAIREHRINRPHVHVRCSPTGFVLRTGRGPDGTWREIAPGVTVYGLSDGHYPERIQRLGLDIGGIIYAGRVAKTVEIGHEAEVDWPLHWVAEALYVRNSDRANWFRVVFRRPFFKRLDVELFAESSSGHRYHNSAPAWLGDYLRPGCCFPIDQEQAPPEARLFNLYFL
jgi:hypothetical protein